MLSRVPRVLALRQAEALRTLLACQDVVGCMASTEGSAGGFGGCGTLQSRLLVRVLAKETLLQFRAHVST